MAFSENYSHYFSTDDFAITASYTPDGGSAKTINGIFDNNYELIDTGEIGVSSTVPMFQCATSDLANASNLDQITINGTDYNVIEVMPDGTGVTMLRLQEQ